MGLTPTRESRTYVGSSGQTRRSGHRDPRELLPVTFSPPEHQNSWTTGNAVASHAMTCHELLRGLNDYVDGETQSALCQAIRTHLADCRPCRVVIDNLRQTITVYRAGQPTPLPAGLHATLRSILEQRWAASFPPFETSGNAGPPDSSPHGE